MDTLPTRVLIVDDDPAFAQVMADLLMEKGFHVTATDDPEHALKTVGDGCDVAILDLKMPRIGGIELAGLLKEKDPDIQIVILTGYGNMETAIEGLHLGVFDYIGKAEIDMRRLERAVREASERTRLIRTNRELVGRLRESNDRLKALQEVSTALSGEPHQDRVLESLARSARELTSSATARAMLFAPSHSDDIVIEAAAGDGAETLVGVRLQPGEGIAALAASSGAAVSGTSIDRHASYSRRCDEMPTLLPGFIAAPLRQGQIRGALVVAGRAGGAFTPEDVALLGALARQGEVAIDNAANKERSNNFFTHASDMLVGMLEQMDKFYPGHSRSVAALSDMVTRRLGVPEAERRSIHYGALLHDIGKLKLRPALLSSFDPVDADEMKELHQHPTFGLEILKPITEWADLLPIVNAHHERWDGAGYPFGHAGEQIPLGARVVAVADAFDAMTRATPHGAKRSVEEALAELEACAGTQFDPKIVRMFVAEYRLRAHQLPK